MAVTEEQMKIVGSKRPTPSGDQTPEQALNLAIADFRAACTFEGIPEPSVAETREALLALPE